MKCVVTIGTYSGGLLGYEVDIGASAEADDKTGKAASLRADMQLTFAYAAHVSCVKAVEARGHILLTGSADETIKVYDLSKKREQGCLMHHSASVTALALYREEGKHCFACSGDSFGLVCVWRSTSDGLWELVAELKGHKSAIVAMAIHPSGRLVASVSAVPSPVLRLWDLTRGTCAFKQDLPHVINSISWSPSGHLFAMLGPSGVEVRSSASEASSLVLGSTSYHVTAAAFVGHEILALGDGRGGIALHAVTSVGDKTTNNQLASTGAADTAEPRAQRIKGLCPLSPSNEHVINFAALDASGALSVWSFNKASSELVELKRVDTQARGTSFGSNVT